MKKKNQDSKSWQTLKEVLNYVARYKVLLILSLVTAAVSVSGPSLRFDPETIIRDAQIISGILQPLQRCI